MEAKGASGLWVFKNPWVIIRLIPCLGYSFAISIRTAFTMALSRLLLLKSEINHLILSSFMIAVRLSFLERSSPIVLLPDPIGPSKIMTNFFIALSLLVTLAGIEPAAFPFGGERSNPLSYRALHYTDHRWARIHRLTIRQASPSRMVKLPDQ